MRRTIAPEPEGRELVFEPTCDTKPGMPAERYPVAYRPGFTPGPYPIGPGPGGSWPTPEAPAPVSEWVPPAQPAGLSDTGLPDWLLDDSGKHYLGFVAPSAVAAVDEAALVKAVTKVKLPVNPILGAFLAGVAIGEFLTSKGRSTTSNAQGWYNPRFEYRHCTGQPGGSRYVGASSMTNAGHSSAPPLDSSPAGLACGALTNNAGFATPALAQPFPTSHVMELHVPGGAALNKAVGSWIAYADPLGLPNQWFQTTPDTDIVLRPGVGTPLTRPRTEDPENFPILQPVNVPAPKKFDDAVADPATQPSSPTKHDTPIEVPAPPFVVVTLPPQVGVVVGPPSVIIEIDPDTGTNSGESPKPEPGQPRPPPPVPGEPGGGGWPRFDPNIKERKLNIRSVAGRLWVVINLFTEGLDFLDVLYDSLPEEIRDQLFAENGGKFLDPLAKAQAIFDNFETLELAEVFENYVNNQFEDLFYGKLGQGTGKASGNFNITTGLDHAIQDAQDAAAGDEPLELPELHYNDAAGKWEVIWYDWVVAVEQPF